MSPSKYSPFLFTYFSQWCFHFHKALLGICFWNCVCHQRCQNGELARLSEQTHYYGKWSMSCLTITVISFCDIFHVTVTKRPYTTKFKGHNSIGSRLSCFFWAWRTFANTLWWLNSLATKTQLPSPVMIFSTNVSPSLACSRSYNQTSSWLFFFCSVIKREANFATNRWIFNDLVEYWGLNFFNWLTFKSSKPFITADELGYHLRKLPSKVSCKISRCSIAAPINHTSTTHACNQPHPHKRPQAPTPLPNIANNTARDI